ncbi:MAG: hypothetical protein NZ949_08440, partial [Candidatus Kapabacteria bacterium]|nr:hypothetical protein [Candidatus Kapabacteria bacterium]
MRAVSLRTQGWVPPDFSWEPGDSVEVHAVVRVAVNPGNNRWQVQVSPLFYATNSNSAFGAQLAPHAPGERISCGVWTDQVELMGFV